MRATLPAANSLACQKISGICKRISLPATALLPIFSKEIKGKEAKICRYGNESLQSAHPIPIGLPIQEAKYEAI